MQHPIDTLTNAQYSFIRLDMDIRSMYLYRIFEQGTQQFNHRALMFLTDIG